MFTQKEVNQLILNAWPDRLEASCALIVGAKSPRFGVLGSGVFFQVADVHFLVTAAHIFREAHLNGLTIGLGCDSNSFLALSDQWLSHSLESFEAFEDSIDIAIYRFTQKELEKLTEAAFLRMSDISSAHPRGIFTVAGYPGSLNRGPRDANATLPVKALALTLPAYEGPPVDLHNFSSADSILLTANSTISTGPDGAPLQMSDISSYAEGTLRDFRGMSGGPVWLVGTSGTNPATWSRDMPRVVGVQIGVFVGQDLLRVTRWTRVIDLMRLGCPELTSALDIVRY
jgi:hypothetical protein